MSQHVNVISKLEIEAEIVLASGEALKGIFFIRQYERVSDLLNDDRPFLPFRDSNGIVHIIAKKDIHLVTPFDKGNQSHAEADLPRFIGQN